MIKFVYRLKNGSQKCLDIFHSFEPVSVSKQKLHREATAILAVSNMVPSMKLHLETKLEELDNTEDDSPKIKEIFIRVKNDINRILLGEYPRYEYIPRRNIIFYHSNLDIKTYNYDIYSLENYDKTKAYPLIIRHSLNKMGGVSSLLHNHNYQSKVIIANVPSRGVTVGSYICEVSIN